MGSGSLLKIILCTLWLDDQKCISDTFWLEVRCITVQVNYWLLLTMIYSATNLARSIFKDLISIKYIYHLCWNSLTAVIFKHSFVREVDESFFFSTPHKSKPIQENRKKNVRLRRIQHQLQKSLDCNCPLLVRTNTYTKSINPKTCVGIVLMHMVVNLFYK